MWKIMCMVSLLIYTRINLLTSLLSFLLTYWQYYLHIKSLAVLIFLFTSLFSYLLYNLFTFLLIKLLTYFQGQSFGCYLTSLFT